MFGAPAGGGLFGAPAASGGGLFGGAAPTGGGLFGGAAPTGGGGGLFGGAAPTGAGGGGLFGAPASSGGMFGGAAPAGGGMFSQPTGGGMFGAAQTGGGLFGAAPAAAQFNPSAMESNFKQIGEQFVQAFYQTYDARQDLSKFYEAYSLFTFEDQDVQGAPQIMQKLGSFGFQQVKHDVKKCRCQPVPGSADKLLVNVGGQMHIQMNGNTQSMPFAESFQLMKKPDGNWCILNDTFLVVQ